jgi:D-alanine-D-alanine ligase
MATKTLKQLRIPAAFKRDKTFMFIAKHALGDGSKDKEDGDHAVYHREVRDVLEAMGLNLKVANSPAALFENPGVDFVFSLLNRGGYLNSEMLLPLLCTRLGVPYLGATPILRGLSDDKHLMKMAARAQGVPTAPSHCYRQGQFVVQAADWMDARTVIKPVASSASWGVSAANNWGEVAAAVKGIHDEGHDALVEPFLSGIDYELPVIGAFRPQYLPLMRFDHDTEVLRTYDEKRGFKQSEARLVQEMDPDLIAQVEGMTEKLLPELWPFDYARFEFRFNTATREFNFLEVNLQCNLWSKRVIGQSALLAGMEYPDLLETIIAGSLARKGLVDPADVIDSDDRDW